MANVLYYMYPFLYIGNFFIKPSCLFLLAFLCLPISHLKVWSQVTNKYRSKFFYSFQNLSVYRRLIARLSALYVIFYLLYWLQPSMGLSGGATHGLITLAEHILQFETVASALLLFLALGVFTIQNNQHQYMQMLNSVINAALLLFTGCTQITRQLSPGWSLINLFILFLISVGLETCQVHAAKNCTDSSNGFLPINSYKELFSSRKHQADQLVTLLQNSDSQPLSICICGDWGSGKTSLVNGALEELLNKCSSQYDVIRINALEIDTLQSLKSYLFLRIRRCLKERGVYVGIGSEYQKFLESAIGSISTPTLVEAMRLRLFPPSCDYREERQKFEEIIANALGEQGRIIIVVDDIERCSEKKAQEFIIFIKEIATMSHCITLFLTNEEQLYKDGQKSDAGSTHLFYEKFFNYRIDVEPIEILPTMLELAKEHYIWNTFGPDTRKPAWIYQSFALRLTDKIEKQNLKITATTTTTEALTSKQEELNRIKDAQIMFQGHLSNPRRLVKLYYILNQYDSQLKKAFNLKSQEETLPELTDYFNKLQLDRLSFYLAYLEVFFPVEAKQLKNKGRKYFEGFTQKERPSVLLYLGEELLFKLNINCVSFDYLHNERLKFIDTFYRNPEHLSDLTSPFCTQDEEWFNILDRGKTDSLESAWIDALEAVFRKFAFCNPNDSDKEAAIKLKRGQGYIKQLFHLAADRLHAKTWTPEKVLSFMNHSRHNESFLSQELAIMEDLGAICGECFVSPSKELHSRLRQFSIEYVSKRMHPAASLLRYLTASNGDERERDLKLLEKVNDELFSDTYPIQERLKTYLASLSSLTSPPDLPKQEDVFVQLKWLANYLEKQLKNNNLLRFDDVRRQLKLMRRSIQDLQHFSALLSQLEETDPISLYHPFSFDSTQIYEALMRSKNMPFKGNHDEYNDIWTLFQRIDSEPEIIFTPEQIEDLQNFVSIYCKQTDVPSSFYRKALLNCQSRLTQLQESSNMEKDK